MKINITLPVFITNDRTLKLTIGCIKSIQTTHEAKVIVVATRLENVDNLQKSLSEVCRYPLYVKHDPSVSKSVAKAWNEGCQVGIDDKADRLLILSNDIILESTTIDNLCNFDDPNCGLWSGISTAGETRRRDKTLVTDGADFSCFMFRPQLIDSVGTFDEHYKPAYLEDNDYYARVVLSGSHCRILYSAGFYHYPSQTVKLEPEAAHHVNHWFRVNESRFRIKWGSNPINNEAGVWARYYKTPWNDPDKKVSFWNQE